jgi:hypothetical protein
MTVTQFYVDLLQCNNACFAGGNIRGGSDWHGPEASESHFGHRVEKATKGSL